MSEPTIREKVLIALIAGEQICAADFARKIGTHSTKITNCLRALGALLHRKDISGGPGNHRVVYTATNVDALRDKIDDEVYAREGIVKPRTSFEELLSAWGISLEPVILDLPTTVHVMMDEPEERLLEGILK